MDVKQPYQLPLPHFLQNLQLREWQAFQMGNKDYFMMVAIYNAKKMALVQFIFYDIQQNQKIRYEKKVLPNKLQLPNTLFGGIASYFSEKFSLRVNHDIGSSFLRLIGEITGFKDLPNVKVRAVGQHNVDKYEPMVVCMPFNERRGMYSHKCLMPMEGRLQIGDRTILFPPEESFLIIDDHKGYYPFPTIYDWVTGMGYTPEGILMGFNLTDNQVIQPKKFNENGLWYNGVLHPLPPIKITRPNGVEKDWIIKDEYGMVDLTFTPVIHTSVNINALIFRSNYKGPYGFFNGFISKKNGEKVEIKQLFGMGEDFYLRC